MPYDECNGCAAEMPTHVELSHKDRRLTHLREVARHHESAAAHHAQAAQAHEALALYHAVEQKEQRRREETAEQIEAIRKRAH